MNKSNVLIVEDNAQTAERLLKYVNEHPKLHCSSVVDTGEKALKLLLENAYDLLALDVHLPDMSGIEVLENLSSHPYVIFITAYDKYAVKAFDLGAVDYLLKPFSKERFDKAIERYLIAKQKSSNSFTNPGELGLSLKDRSAHYLIPFDDIVYISSHGKHTVVHTTHEDIEVAKIFKDIEIRLSPDNFIRIHKQYLVNIIYFINLEHTQSGHYLLRLKDEDETVLPVGRTYSAEVKERLLV